MKPSERIHKIHHGRDWEEETSSFINRKIDAVIQYLDEEWEKNKPCEHLNSYQVDGTGDIYYNVCNDCGVLFLAN